MGEMASVLRDLFRFIFIVFVAVFALTFISMILLCSSVDGVCFELVPSGTIFRLRTDDTDTCGHCILPRGQKRPEVLCGGAHDSCVPKHSIERTAMMTFAEPYHLAVCHIPKNMLTVSMAIVCCLSEPKRFASKNKTVTTDLWSNRTCFQRNEMRFPNAGQTADRRWMHLAIVRDPIEKFLSGWLEKCYYRTPDNVHWKANQCYKCGQNLTCFVHKNYEKLMKKTALAPAWGEEDHFWPQNWFCGFKSYRSRYKLLKFEHGKNTSFFRSLFSVLRTREVPSDLISTIESQVVSSLTKHSTFNRPQTLAIGQQLMCDKELLRVLVKTYYHDYDMLGFNIPCF